VRLAVEEQPAAPLGALLQGVRERQRLVAVAPGDGEHLRRSTAPLSIIAGLGCDLKR